MTTRFFLGVCILACWVSGIKVAHAQDVPGIEICTVEKTMERRTSCLQSNVDFLQKTIARLDAQHQQKLDAANRQIDLLKANVAALQKIVGDLQAAQHKPSDEAKKTSAPPDAAAKDTAAKDPTANGTTAKETTKNAVTKDAAKEGGK
jgi:hypothetical protein